MQGPVVCTNADVYTHSTTHTQTHIHCVHMVWRGGGDEKERLCVHVRNYSEGHVAELGVCTNMTVPD